MAPTFRRLGTTVPRVLDAGRAGRRRRQHEPIEQERMRIPLPAMGSCAVGDRTVGYVEYNHGMGLLIDQVADAPLLPTARGVLARVFIAKRVADAIGIV